TEEIKKTLMPNLEKNHLKEVLGSKVVKVDMLDGIKFICEDSSWLLFRLSGTEPILRIYAEAKSRQRASDMLEFGKKIGAIT
ncbi:MAG: phosphoglucomutase/phosphomannomutase family protein, partial [Candidatus Omnitrophota bacterium]